jgi:hypothetical protein
MTIYFAIYVIGVLLTSIYIAIIQSFGSLLSLKGSTETLIEITSVALIAGAMWPLLAVVTVLAWILDWAGIRRS